jgi:FkbM family methyltransferase
VLLQVLGHRDAAIPLQNQPRFIVDAGANVGYTSLLFALTYPEAFIVAIEPDRTNCAIWRKNCIAYHNIQLLEGALWPHSAALRIVNPSSAAFGYQVDESDDADNGGHICAYTLSDILQLHNACHIDLLKLDIEGAEVRLFSENPECWLRHVTVILVELHDRYVAGCSEAFSAMLRDTRHTRERHGEYECVRLTHD